MSATSKKATRTQLSNNHKRDICELARQTHGQSQAQIAKLVQVKMGLSISRSTLTKILRNETKLLSLAPQQGTRKRQRAGKYEGLEVALWHWFSQATSVIHILLTDKNI